MAVALLAAVVMQGCGGATRGAEHTAVQPARAPAAKADSAHVPHAAVDAQFMSSMIGHHAQAVLIAGWAPTHDASQSVRVLCERIVVGQRDEMSLMERWLRERGETVPGADSSHQMPGMDHSGMHHSTLMPGMLTAEQLSQLDHARGPEFDRLFLTFMIKHHQGALTMVDQLFGSQGAAQDETVFRLASDVYADQSTEIDRMQKMLAALPTQSSHQ
jgi:uncharacterized protein (DUF305 family)